MKRVLILMGSPRRQGNTSALVRAFTQGAESAVWIYRRMARIFRSRWQKMVLSIRVPSL